MQYVREGVDARREGEAMRLTKEQLNHTKIDVMMHAQDSITLVTVEVLAAAYERVAALLEHEYEYSATIPWDAVRCALYGDAPEPKKE